MLHRQIVTSLRSRVRNSSAVAAAVAKDGRSLDVNFTDGTAFRFHASWLKDSVPTNVGPDWNRLSVAGMGYLQHLRLTNVSVQPSGDVLRCEWSGSDGDNNALESDLVSSPWLRAYAPTVGKALNSQAEHFQVDPRSGDDALGLLQSAAKPWMAADLNIEYFEAQHLLESTSAKLRFIEHMLDPGIAMVTNMPKDFDPKRPGDMVIAYLMEVMGRSSVHPTRLSKDYFEISSGVVTGWGKDYDVTKALTMHTDQVGYEAGGFLGWMHQYSGTSRGRVGDALAVSEYMRSHHPQEWKLLTEVQVYHGHRHQGYTKVSGVPVQPGASMDTINEFELSHAHPILKVDSNGTLIQAVHSEHKRANLDIPFDVFEEFVEAYTLFCDLAEQDRFVKEYDWAEGDLVVINNHRLLHGRANVSPGKVRAITGGKHARSQVANRYRLLRMEQMKEKECALEEQWYIRTPNSVLERM